MHLLPQFVLILVAQTAPVSFQPASAAKTFSGHAADVYDVAFSPDGKLLATASFDKSVKLWNVESGAEIATLTGHEGKVLALAFSANGRALLTGSDDKSAKLWDVPAEGAAALARHDAAVEAMLLAPDGAHLLSAGADGTVRIFQRAGGKEVLKLPAGSPLHALALDPAARLVAAAGDDKTVRVWDVSSITAPAAAAVAAGGAADIAPQGASWRIHKGKAAPPDGWNKAEFDDAQWTEAPSGFGYSADAAELASVKTKLDDMQSQQYLSLYARVAFSLDDPKKVERLVLRVIVDDGYVAYLNGAEVDRKNVDGSPPAFNGAASGSTEPMPFETDLTPHLAKLVAGKNVLAIQGHNASVSSSDFVLTPSLGAVIKADAPAKEEEAKNEAVLLAGCEGAVRAVAFSADGSLVAAGGDDKAVRVFNVKEAKVVAKLDCAGVVRGLAFLADGSLAVSDSDGPIDVWNVSEGKVARQLEGFRGGAQVLAVSKDRALLAAGDDAGSVRIWEAANGKELRVLAAQEGAVTAVAFSGDGKLVLSGGADKTLKAWRVEDGSEAAKFTGGGAISAVAALALGRYYAVPGGAEIQEFRVVSPQAVQTFSGHGGFVHAVAFAPDGGSVVTASSDKTVRFWNPADGKQTRSINAHDSSVYCLAFSPDGKLLASGGFDRAIKVWNVETGAEQKKLEGHGEGVFCLEFLASGSTLFLFSGSSDRSLRKWDVNEGKQVAVYEGHPGWVCGLALLPGGERMVSIDYGGHLITWGLADGKPIVSRRTKPVVYDLDLSADGQWIATANPDHASLIIGVSP